MTYRPLLAWLMKDASGRDGAELDMAVVVRVEGEDGEFHVGGLYDVEVDPGHDDQDALLLDGACDVVDPVLV